MRLYRRSDIIKLHESIVERQRGFSISRIRSIAGPLVTDLLVDGIAIAIAIRGQESDVFCSVVADLTVVAWTFVLFLAW